MGTKERPRAKPRKPKPNIVALTPLALKHRDQDLATLASSELEESARGVAAHRQQVRGDSSVAERRAIDRAFRVSKPGAAEGATRLSCSSATVREG